MRLRRLLLVPTLALAAWLPVLAAEPAVADFTVANGKELIAHWALTPWAKTWAEPALAPLHAPFNAWQQEAAKTLGGTPLELLAALGNLGGSLRAGTMPTKPAFVAGAEFGSFAAKLYALAKEADAGAVTVPVLGADEAFHHPKPGQEANLLARFATAMAIGINTLPVRPMARLATTTGDVTVAADLPALMRLIMQVVAEPEAKSRLAEMDAQFARNGIGAASYRMDLVAEGFLERISITVKKMAGYRPVDRDLLARLPASTLLALGFGFDGAEAWKTERASLLSGWAPLVGTDPKNIDATELALNQAFVKFGMPVKIADLFQGMVGTAVVAVTPGIPFPGVSMALPRSPATDQAIISLLAKIDAKAPDEGASIPLPLPGVPVAVTLVREAKSWFITSDLTASDNWLMGKPGGWADTPAMKLALSKATPDAYVIGASDTPAVLRLIAGYAGMALGMAKTMPAEYKQATLQGLNLLATHAATGYIVAGRQGEEVVTEVRSITGAVSAPILAGGIAGWAFYQRAMAEMGDGDAMHRMPPKVTSAKRGPAQILRSVVFPAEIQFQAGTYIDQDGDGIGEYGLLSELGGRRALNGPAVALLEGQLAKGAVVDDYAYAIYLPTAGGRLADDGKKEARPAVATDADAQEKSFVAYAWPVRAKTGTMYALTVNGAVYEAPFAGQPPAWNAVFGDQGWQDIPTWSAAGAGGTHVEPAPAEPAVLP